MAGKVRLVALSFVMLFVELALIRWIGSNVVYLSYFSNFVLMGSFLGIGVGFLRGKSRLDLFPWAIVALAFLVGFVLIFPVQIDRSGDQLIFFGTFYRGLPLWVTLPIVFLASALIMSAIAQGVAKSFSQFEPLEAYRLDILGSLAGIALFSLLSFLGAPPVVWGAIAGSALLLLYLPALRVLQVLAAIAVIVLLGRESLEPGTSWSPYYKILLYPAAPGITALFVNGVPHQGITSTAIRRQRAGEYFWPYQRIAGNPLRNVLIIGAGNGPDVAIALAQGAKHIDAVEIDPRIYQIGRQLNPDHPYQNPRVTAHVDDGRAFLHKTHNRYDLILLSLPDSLALVAGQSSLRLESYLFTLEAMREARDHLTSRGAFGMYNFYREDWLVDRYASTLQLAFGEAPCIDTVGITGKFDLLMVGSRPGNVSCATRWNPGGRALAAPSTDDRPFPYLRSPQIPSTYLVTLALILLVSLALVRVAVGPLTPMKSYADLFFMGAAFLLLETKNVVQFALLFGTTWFVNALVFFGILVAVLAAIEVARRVSFRNPVVLYAALFGTLLLAWLIQPEALLSLDVPLRFLAACSLAFGPIFLANVIFAQRFRDVGSSTVAFGANLLGAMVGGVLEYGSLLLGYRNLLVAVAVLYALAFLLGRKALAPQPATPREALGEPA